ARREDDGADRGREDGRGLGRGRGRDGDRRRGRPVRDADLGGDRGRAAARADGQDREAGAGMSDPFRPTPARRGLDELLSRYPFLDVLVVMWGGEPLLGPETSPWLRVTLGQRSLGEEEAWARWEFAIWKTTGAVYSMRQGGAVSDDPIIEVS